MVSYLGFRIFYFGFSECQRTWSDCENCIRIAY